MIRNVRTYREEDANYLITVIVILLFGVPFCLPPNLIPVLLVFII